MVGMKQILNEILANPLFSEGAAWKRLRYKSGEKIIEKGDIGNSLFLIENGVVRVLGDVQSDVKVSPGFCDLGDGALFGDACLYGAHKRTASIMAVTDVCILEIHSEMLSAYLDMHPVQGYQFLKKLFKIMAIRLELANERIENLLAWGIKAHDIDKYL